jgi:hypothetical protein
VETLECPCDGIFLALVSEKVAEHGHPVAS